MIDKNFPLAPPHWTSVKKGEVLEGMSEPPLKRQRVDGVTDKKDEWSPVVRDADDDLGVKYTREIDVGITEFINKEFEGFDCILKYKYVPFRRAEQVVGE